MSSKHLDDLNRCVRLQMAFPCHANDIDYTRNETVNLSDPCRLRAKQVPRLSFGLRMIQS